MHMAYESRKDICSKATRTGIILPKQEHPLTLEVSSLRN